MLWFIRIFQFNDPKGEHKRGSITDRRGGAREGEGERRREGEAGKERDAYTNADMLMTQAHIYECYPAYRQ